MGSAYTTKTCLLSMQTAPSQPKICLRETVFISLNCCSLVDPVKGMDHKDFVELVSQYKFAISMENGVCKDYITEKLWRPLIVGTVPITFGAPNLQVCGSPKLH